MLKTNNASLPCQVCSVHAVNGLHIKFCRQGIWGGIIKLLAIIMSVIISGCHHLRYYENDYDVCQTYTVKNNYYTAAYLRPDSISLSSNNGRFCPGGWLLSLKDMTGGELLEQKSIVPNQYAYGCPFEFVDIIHKEHHYPVRIGVGNIDRPDMKTGFYDKVMHRFPWESRMIKSGDESFLYYNQLVKQHYSLTIEITFSQNSNIICYNLKFRNLSDKRIESEFYWHPFLSYTHGACWYSINDDIPQYLPEGYVDTEKINTHIASLDIGKKNSRLLRFDFSRPLSKMIIWKDKTVFSVEPFDMLHIDPGQTASFSWSIKVYSDSRDDSIQEVR